MSDTHPIKATKCIMRKEWTDPKDDHLWSCLHDGTTKPFIWSVQDGDLPENDEKYESIDDGDKELDKLLREIAELRI
uniref:Uncharacterized protein n=1 Tax=Mimivirus LCMiAC01 TaxID=2506608 RepID=A0A481YZJ1_9VIRU|nr:MAG: hypothetical protein LCMiAC01_03510 [Mimivirus LCMiAC01]